MPSSYSTDAVLVDISYGFYNAAKCSRGNPCSVTIGTFQVTADVNSGGIQQFLTGSSRLALFLPFQANLFLKFDKLREQAVINELVQVLIGCSLISGFY